jgi:ketosteroid isomerase-like protein
MSESTATPGDNLAAVLGAFLEAHRSGRTDALTALLAEDVVWEGPVPGTRCNNRNEAMDILGRRFAADHRLRITHLEAVEDGDRVVIAALGPDFHPDGEAGPEGELYLVFTVQDGRVVRMRGMASRAEAFAGA